MKLSMFPQNVLHMYKVLRRLDNALVRQYETLFHRFVIILIPRHGNTFQDTQNPFTV